MVVTIFKLCSLACPWSIFSRFFIFIVIQLLLLLFHYGSLCNSNSKHTFWGLEKSQKIGNNLDEVVSVVAAQWAGRHTYFCVARNVLAIRIFFRRRYTVTAIGYCQYRMMLNA